jgi:hypothetical protein
MVPGGCRGRKKFAVSVIRITPKPTAPATNGMKQEPAMPVAQVIQFEERQAAARPRRKPEPAACVILRFPQPAALPAVSTAISDDDWMAGRGRDPG